MHPNSTQSRKSIYKVINNAKALFEMSETEAEVLANKAGLSLFYNEKGWFGCLNYRGKWKELYDKALLSERMFWNYRNKCPGKQPMLAVLIAMELQLEDIDYMLHQSGYCLSKSIYADRVVMWFLETHKGHLSGGRLLKEINHVLDKMELPLLMTRQNK